MADREWQKIDGNRQNITVVWHQTVGDTYWLFRGISDTHGFHQETLFF
jgi:hypothetical protein